MSHAVTAPTAAKVGSIVVEAGQRVAPADLVVVLETAVTQTPVLAQVAGTVAELRVDAGDMVAAGDPLVIVED